MRKLRMHVDPVWCNLPWWTETNAAWVQAIGITAAFAGQLILLWLTLKEQRYARRDRRHAEIARQRDEVTCAGVWSIVRSFSEEQLCNTLWAGNFKHGGFAFEKELYAQLPDFLRRKCDPFMEDIQKVPPLEQLKIARFLLVFRFPYPEYDAVLYDINRLNFGNVHVVWDNNGKPIRVPRG